MESKNAILERRAIPGELKLVHFSGFNKVEYARIIGVISHDISNPVSILKSNIQLFRDDLKKREDVFNEEVLCLCEDSIEELVRFLDNIRLINSSLKSEISPKICVFEIDEILGNLYGDLDYLSLDHQRINIQYDIEVKEILSDLDFLRCILLNVLSNALKFSKSEVNLNISSKQSNLEITVQDFGVGIPEDEIDKIFNPFFRATNAKNYPGIGLGLSVVKSLTESIGGQIFLSSLINQGSIIRIVFPNEQTN